MDNNETNPLDVLTESCFGLLGALQEKDVESDEWKAKFSQEMHQMATIMNHFLQQK